MKKWKMKNNFFEKNGKLKNGALKNKILKKKGTFWTKKINMKYLKIKISKMCEIPGKNEK